jgi:anaerobic magnesium-protoporphyrin IX monomethyl ester cyclase
VTNQIQKINNKKPVVLINPNLVAQRNDVFTTGIVYMPVSLAYIAAMLRRANYEVLVIDAFGEKPFQCQRIGNFLFMGLTTAEIIARLPENARAVFVYAINLTNHISTMSIVRSVKNNYPNFPVVVLENTQAVTAYSLRLVASEFYEAGADYIITGEADERSVRLVESIINNGQGTQNDANQIDGLGSPDHYTMPDHFIQNLDNLPFPAWDLFPLENYWKLRFAHGPQSTKQYLPLLTSRGCPYPCKFCVVPATNNQRWRARSSQNVVDEMEYFLQKYGVHEFHIEDLDPTISDQRIRDICQEIIRRQLQITWKIVAGTKVETIRNEETIDLMAKAGCRYISISPETGSPRLLKLMRKPFDLHHAICLIKKMNQVGIRSQACFILGYPGETEQDLQLTWKMVQNLTHVGVDEIALFIVTPVPGSVLYQEFKGYKSLSELNFSPIWREDYKNLNKFRIRLYIAFLFWKLFYHPIKLIRQPLNFLFRRFETKMEMVPYRALIYKLLDVFTHSRQRK